MSTARDEDIHDMPPYPADWTPEQRVSAYWFALNHTRLPSTTDGWRTVDTLAHRERERLDNLKDRR